MKTLHIKSPCCQAKIYHFGNRRRQCSLCKKTWRIRVKKRGRKNIRVHPNIESTVIRRKESLRHQSSRLNKGREKVRKHHHKNLELLLKSTSPTIAPRGQLIAIIDGWHLYFKKQKYTVYLILLRSINDNRAIIMEPVLINGWENKNDWERVFSLLPSSVQKRIKAVVSDGITGIEGISNERGWILQRCHFHQLKMLQTLRGQKWSTINNKELREHIYQNVCKILETPSDYLANKLFLETKQLLQKPECPKWLKRRVSGFLRRVDNFRAYRKYPHLNLPITTNSAECVWQGITETFRLTRGFSTPKSFELWLKVQLRTTKTIKCNGKIFNQINVS